MNEPWLSWQTRRSPEELYNWYDDQVERRESCKLASPLRHQTQPWLSCASESTHPLRFPAKQASTPDLVVNCESCVTPDSPNLSKEKKVPDKWRARQAIPAMLQVCSSKRNAKKNTKRVEGPRASTESKEEKEGK